MNKIEARFWAKVKILSEDQCWNWVGGSARQKRDKPYSPKNSGYGSFKFGEVKCNSHIVAFCLTHGFTSIPKENGKSLFVCHTCDNRLCCNPAHLYLGTSKDNVKDMVVRNRHGMQTLTIEQVTELRELGERLAEQYNTTVSVIGRTIAGRGYAYKSIPIL